MHCEEYVHIRTWHIYNTDYIKGLKPCSKAFTTFEKQTTNHENNVETQTKHMYS